MKNFLIATLALALISGAAAFRSYGFAAQGHGGWHIDSNMKFNFGYLPPSKEKAPEASEKDKKNVKNAAKSEKDKKNAKNAEAAEKDKKAEQPAAVPEPDKNFEAPADLGFTSPFLPDITNIALDDFIKLGFPVTAPAAKGKYNLFIKLFNFPAAFKPELSSTPIIKGYQLDKLANGKLLTEYAADSKNLAVKFCHIAKSDAAFSAQNPFPAFKVNTVDKDAQNAFIESTVFSSLYVTPAVYAEGETAEGELTKSSIDGKTSENELEKPLAGDETSENELARCSARGVQAFHTDIIKMFSEKLIALTPAGDDKHYYYGYKTPNGPRSVLSVIKIPRKPLVFENWRELPMPQDPAGIFLSGLLLLHRYDYAKNEGAILTDSIPVFGSSGFKEQFSKVNEHVLEIGSVVKLKKELSHKKIK
jgi:hypothetical protein